MLADLLAMPAHWGIAQIAIAIVICAGIIALVVIGLKKLGVTFPEWVQQAFWVIVVVVVIVAAIKIVASL